MRSLFFRYWIILVGLVATILLVGGGAELYFRFRESVEQRIAMQQALVQAASDRINTYLSRVERQVRGVADLPWQSGELVLSDQREESQRLLKIVPEINEVRWHDRDCREVMFISRIESDRVGSGLPCADTFQRLRGLTAAVGFGPTVYRVGSEPYVSMLVLPKSPAALYAVEATIDLKFIANVINRLRVDGGLAYLVDADRQVIAHPDLNLVLRRTTVADIAPPRLAEGEASTRWATSVTGEKVLQTRLLVPSTGWHIHLEQSSSFVLGNVYRALARTFGVLLAGMLVSLLVAWWLAKHLSSPILTLRRGAKALADGQLDARLDLRGATELVELGHQFNDMAQRLQESHNTLELKVAEKTAQLSVASKNKSDFLANLSHELRTPLNAVIGFADALRLKMFGDLTPKQSEYVAFILESSRHLLSLINDVLDLAKIEAGHMDLNRGEVALQPMVDTVFALTRDRAQEQQLELENQIDPALTLQADARKLKQILLNLVSNAIKFNRSGGRVTVAARQSEDQLEISVTDTGIGIAEADLPNLFKEFSRIKTDTQIDGFGLGLSLTRQLARLHGGDIRVESRLGEGSVFTILLPANPPPSPTTDA